MIENVSYLSPSSRHASLRRSILDAIVPKDDGSADTGAPHSTSSTPSTLTDNADLTNNKTNDNLGHRPSSYDLSTSSDDTTAPTATDDGDNTDPNVNGNNNGDDPSTGGGNLLDPLPPINLDPPTNPNASHIPPLVPMPSPPVENNPEPPFKTDPIPPVDTPLPPIVNTPTPPSDNGTHPNATATTVSGVHNATGTGVNLTSPLLPSLNITTNNQTNVTTSGPLNSTATGLTPTPTSNATNHTTPPPLQTVYVTQTNPAGAVETVVNVVPSSSDANHVSHPADHSNLPLGPIIGGVAAGICALVVLCWLVSIPLRRHKQIQSEIQWQGFPTHHQSRHGVGDGEDDEDDEDGPANSAAVVYGHAAGREINSRQSSGEPKADTSATDHSWLQQGYEMSSVPGHVGFTGVGSPTAGAAYGVNGFYPYSNLDDGGFDATHAAFYQERDPSHHNAVGSLSTSTHAAQPMAHNYGMGGLSMAQDAPPPPWRPGENVTLSRSPSAPPHQHSPQDFGVGSPPLRAMYTGDGSNGKPSLPVPSPTYAPPGAHPPLPHSPASVGDNKSMLGSLASPESSPLGVGVPQRIVGPTQVVVPESGHLGPPSPAASAGIASHPSPTSSSSPHTQQYFHRPLPKPQQQPQLSSHPQSRSRTLHHNSSNDTTGSTSFEDASEQMAYDGLAPPPPVGADEGASTAADGTRASVMPSNQESLGHLRIANPNALHEE
ncbi:unnamed protein product [Jaminaea pallidilutea]